MVLNSENLNTSIGNIIYDIVGSLVHRNDNIFVMKRGKTLNSFLVFKYRLRSTIITIFERSFIASLNIPSGK
jgi:hypothetical protein